MGSILSFLVFWYVDNQRHWLIGSIGFQHSRVRLQSAWPTRRSRQNDRKNGLGDHWIYRRDALRSSALPGKSTSPLDK